MTFRHLCLSWPFKLSLKHCLTSFPLLTCSKSNETCYKFLLWHFQVQRLVLLLLLYNKLLPKSSDIKYSNHFIIKCYVFKYWLVSTSWLSPKFSHAFIVKWRLGLASPQRLLPSLILSRFWLSFGNSSGDFGWTFPDSSIIWQLGFSRGFVLV